MRFLPSVPSLIYSISDDDIYFNQYISNESKISFGKDTFFINLQSEFPWNGEVNIDINPDFSIEKTLNFRVPSWDRNEVMSGHLYEYVKVDDIKPEIYINGNLENVEIENGYFKLTRKWKKEDKIKLVFPMDVKLVRADDRVIDDKGKVALERGPIVYAIEEIDNRNNFDSIFINQDEKFSIKNDKVLEEDIISINGHDFKAIPYFAWSNRGVGKMKVWLPFK
ncbi:MAG: glycoside hydrolase family 127 protein [Saprospiraceae bacterium]